MPIVSTLCVVGAYALNNSNFDLISLIFFGGLGYILTKASIPLAPLLLAMILSGIIETNFRRAMSLFNNDFTVFFTRPISAFFVIIFGLFTRKSKCTANRLKITRRIP